MSLCSLVDLSRCIITRSLEERSKFHDIANVTLCHCYFVCPAIFLVFSILKLFSSHKYLLLICRINEFTMLLFINLLFIKSKFKRIWYSRVYRGYTRAWMRNVCKSSSFCSRQQKMNILYCIWGVRFITSQRFSRKRSVRGKNERGKRWMV